MDDDAVRPDEPAGLRSDFCRLGHSLADQRCPASGVTGNSQSSYSGYTTTLTDAVSNSRTNAVDGLGRLTSVTENSLSGSPVTSYTYDALDHLTGVSQASTSRSFVYDSLGRLSSATNPESGLTCYGTVSGTCNPFGGYDGNGNLLKRTDANSVVTTMTYDSLNRILGKSYSGSAAPAVSYDYDTNHSVTGDSATNYKAGRLTQVSSSVSGTVFRYDALGRVQSSMQTTGSNTYPFLYGYAAFAWGGIHGFLISGMYLLWIALSIATSRYFAFPWGALAVSWLALFWVAAWDWSYWRNNPEMARVYFYGYPIAYIVASHAGYLLALRKQSPKILADRSSV